MERKGREGEREGERSKGGCLSLPIQEVMETEQMRQVSSAIQDLDNQIEEQKLKIQNTANTSLRVSLCGFLVCMYTSYLQKWLSGAVVCACMAGYFAPY